MAAFGLQRRSALLEYLRADSCIVRLSAVGFVSNLPEPVARYCQLVEPGLPQLEEQ